MKIWTTYELQTLSRAQLQALLEEMLVRLSSLRTGSVEYATMLAVIADIRDVLARLGLVRPCTFKPPSA